MAAAEAATTAGTRRAVVRSERFVQWQQELSSARRAPYGSRKRNVDGKMTGNQNQQKESENVSGLKGLRDEEDGGGEDDAYESDISQERAKKQQQQGQRQSSDCKRAEKVLKSCLLISREAGLCDGEQTQQEQQAVSHQDQQGPSPPRPLRRRGCRALNKDQELDPSPRGVADDTNDKVDHVSSLASKRSTRLLAKTLCTEEPPPPPLKLPKLHVVLSRKEVHEDWLKMTGRRYSGKPRKSALTHLGLGLCTSMTCPSMIRRYLNDP